MKVGDFVAGRLHAWRVRRIYGYSGREASSNVYQLGYGPCDVLTVRAVPMTEPNALRRRATRLKNLSIAASGTVEHCPSPFR